MNVTKYAAPAEFLEAAQPFLEGHEAENNLILGIAIRLVERPDWESQPPYLATVAAGGQVALAAVITPPHNLLLAARPEVDAVAIERLMQKLLSDGAQFSAVVAESRLARHAAEMWSRLSGRPARLKMRHGIYQLRRVIPPPHPAPGTLSQANPGDEDLVTAWRTEFIRESLHETPGEDVRPRVQRLIAAGLQYLWIDGEPVSMATVTRPIPHGISIGSVYTPPEQRRRGYASACVAALSQQQLDAGRRFCTLFTDLDYPESNSIYQKIGYEAVGEFDEIEFLVSGQRI